MLFTNEQEKLLNYYIKKKQPLIFTGATNFNDYFTFSGLLLNCREECGQKTYGCENLSNVLYVKNDFQLDEKTFGGIFPLHTNLLQSQLQKDRSQLLETKQTLLVYSIKDKAGKMIYQNDAAFVLSMLGDMAKHTNLDRQNDFSNTEYEFLSTIKQRIGKPLKIIKKFRGYFVSDYGICFGLNYAEVKEDKYPSYVLQNGNIQIRDVAMPTSYTVLKDEQDKVLFAYGEENK